MKKVYNMQAIKFVKMIAYWYWLKDYTTSALIKLWPMSSYEKTMLMYTKHIPLHYFNYLTFCVRYVSYVNCISFPIASCAISENFTATLCLDKKLLKFKVGKSGQSCVHISTVFSFRVTYIHWVRMKTETVAWNTWLWITCAFYTKLTYFHK